MISYVTFLACSLLVCYRCFIGLQHVLFSCVLVCLCGGVLRLFVFLHARLFAFVGMYVWKDLAYMAHVARQAGMRVCI